MVPATDAATALKSTFLATVSEAPAALIALADAAAVCHDAADCRTNGGPSARAVAAALLMGLATRAAAGAKVAAAVGGALRPCATLTLTTTTPGADVVDTKAAAAVGVDVRAGATLATAATAGTAADLVVVADAATAAESASRTRRFLALFGCDAHAAALCGAVWRMQSKGDGWAVLERKEPLWVIVTASVGDAFFGGNPARRKAEYERGWSALNAAVIAAAPHAAVTFVEGGGDRPTYFDGFGAHRVLYTGTNVARSGYTPSPNKATREFNDVRATIDALGVPDGGLVVKVTGRYELLDTSFFTAIAGPPGSATCVATGAAAVLKWFNVCTRKYLPRDCVLGLYAARAGVLRAFTIDDDLKGGEVAFASFLRDDPRVAGFGALREVTHLGLRAHFATAWTLDV